MDLVKHETPALVKHTGQEEGLVVSAGQDLKIETSPNGEDVLSATCPEGKQWTVVININVDEADV